MKNTLTRNYEYFFKEHCFSYSISVDTKLFIPGADSIAYAGNSLSPLAIVNINDYSLALYALGSVHLVNHSEDISYEDKIPSYLMHLLDANAEHNLSKYNISIEERNHFEYILFKKDEQGFLTEQNLEFHKEFKFLDSSLESFFDELQIIAIMLIQSESLSSQDEYPNDFVYIQDFAVDDFEVFAINNSIEAYIPSF